MSVDASAVDQPTLGAEVEEEGEGVSRREFLNYAWLASLGIFVAELAGASYLFAMPRFRAGEFGGIFPLSQVQNQPEVGAAPDKNPKGRFWFVRSEEGIYALYVVCTHLGCLFQWSSTEGRFDCPCHGSRFSRTGEYLAGPAPRNLDSFVVQMVDQDGNVLEETPQSADRYPAPTPVPSPNARIIVDTGNRITGTSK